MKFKNTEQAKRALRALQGKHNPPKYLGIGAVKIDEDLFHWSKALEEQCKREGLDEPISVYFQNLPGVKA